MGHPMTHPKGSEKRHWSDCAIYNLPGEEGPCDCGGYDGSKPPDTRLKMKISKNPADFLPNKDNPHAD